MLDDKNSQLMRWLKGLFDDKFSCIDIYATNIVKCSINYPPSTQAQGGLKFLKEFFMHCNKYLVEEIGQYQPDLLLTFGEPIHKLFCTIIKDAPSSDFNEGGI
jgi:uracil-DNA glycosylase